MTALTVYTGPSPPQLRFFLTTFDTTSTPTLIFWASNTSSFVVHTYQKNIINPRASFYLTNSTSVRYLSLRRFVLPNSGSNTPPLFVMSSHSNSPPPPAYELRDMRPGSPGIPAVPDAPEAPGQITPAEETSAKKYKALT
ncbi:uncharacterized protein BDZ83DRAFT_657799 [Colletotrichum acutatum]|uniref:Uncharacterized protein n=1 Tax=Glomerella acutata TaxID=27357 RepID=A0AAD8UBY7_GLOAC|nr:uncharacterized protein BDZ83DRAFT_657799 [Colletotrichum acutatum]KAK1707132.1 hypothetical protein BDZ83DRAFT_657799 [Colletotrichum acutatum]